MVGSPPKETDVTVNVVVFVTACVCAAILGIMNMERCNGREPPQRNRRHGKCMYNQYGYNGE